MSRLEIIKMPYVKCSISFFHATVASPFSEFIPAIHRFISLLDFPFNRQNFLRQIMNRGRAPSFSNYSSPGGRSSRAADHSSHRGRHMAVADGDFSDDSFSRRNGTSHSRRRSANPISPSSFTGRSNYRPARVYRPKKPLEDGSIHSEMLQQDQNDSNASDCESKQLESFMACNSGPEGSSAFLSACSSLHDNVMKIQAGQVPTAGAVNEGTLCHDLSSKVNSSTLQNHPLPSLNSNVKDHLLQQERAKSTECNRDSEHQTPVETFDIFLPRTGTPVILKPSLLAKNREKRNEIKRAIEFEGKILRPGMVLLKRYLSMDDQVKMVKLCRELGIGPGGFCQPSYHDGAKMHLRMMCLGRNWDPNTSSYGERRPIDGAKPPKIPHEFCSLVEKAMKDTCALIERNPEASSVEDTFPWMSPDICIVNFYSASGRLGLHQV
ncbi:hypothetical protein MANES_11G015800v8 [Manihot esculenta]|uniref:Uncharacterized protein n=1 Tax=Manihot esculenta TaxID=3983 RepID=A0ACB7GWX2_MANES|nr:hypothetical protein MANES_11G015800v8 [Manihot esculenta]